MELLCIEQEYEPIALFDSVIVDDDRTLTNLIFTEEHYLITGSYFKCLQTELNTNNRSELASWMLEVCLSVCLSCFVYVCECVFYLILAIFIYKCKYFFFSIPFPF